MNTGDGIYMISTLEGSYSNRAYCDAQKSGHLGLDLSKLSDVTLAAIFGGYLQSTFFRSNGRLAQFDEYKSN